MDSYSCCSQDKKEYRSVTDLARLLRLAGEESRLKILCILKSGSHCVCEIEKHLDLSQSLISHHLRDLKQGGLIASNKNGLFIYYSLTPKGRKTVKTLFSLERGKL